MIEVLSNLSHWIADFAGTPWAVLVLALHSFTESIFNPIPVDPLIVPMSFLRPELAFLYAAVATLSSVAGALLGHWMGQRLGHPLLLRFLSAEKIARVETLFQRYGPWAILVAAITPVPYKVFAITAGVLEMDRRPFLLFSLIGRGVRFFFIAGLIIVFGRAVERYVERYLGTNFEVLTAGVAALLTIVAVAVFFIMNKRATKDASTKVQDELAKPD